MATHAVYPTCGACDKIRYPSAHTARLACRRTGNRIRVYQAHGGFHITNQDREPKRETKRKR